MCGIAEVVSLDGREACEARPLLAMTSRMVHRGTDDDGYLSIDKGGNMRTFMGGDRHLGLPAMANCW